MAKIILIEDDAEISGIVAKALTKEGHLVESFSTGRPGLEMLLTYTYDLVVLDWNLPDMLGPDIAREYRNTGGMTPIIMLTGRSALKEKTSGFDAGVDDYLTKPFELAELMARVKALLRRPVAMVSSTIEFNGVTIDTTAKRVTLDGTEVALQPKEYAVLELFFKHPNEVFSQQAILDRIWSSDADVIADSVYTTVKSLRKKLKGKDPLETVYGAGYRLRKS